MFQRARTLWQENRAGLTGSVLLHILSLSWSSLWWGLGHPVVRQPPLKAMLVDLVAAPTDRARALPAAPQTPLRAPVPAAPKSRACGQRPSRPPPDELEVADRCDGAIARARHRPSRPRQWRRRRQRYRAAAMPWRISCGRRSCGAGGRNWQSDAARGMPVAIRLKLSRAGVISDVQIVDQARFANDKLFRDMALIGAQCGAAGLADFTAAGKIRRRDGYCDHARSASGASLMPPSVCHAGKPASRHLPHQAFGHGGRSQDQAHHAMADLSRPESRQGWNNHTRRRLSAAPLREAERMKIGTLFQAPPRMTCLVQSAPFPRRPGAAVGGRVRHSWDASNRRSSPSHCPACRRGRKDWA